MRNSVFTLMVFISGLFMTVNAFNVTFSLDVQTWPETPTEVVMNGGITGWTSHALNNVGGTIWEVTVDLPASTSDFRFEIVDVNGWHPEWPGNDASGSCFVNGNMRSITVSKDSIMETVCWESCTACSSPLPQITLTIDMSPYTATEFNKVTVNGGFNGWGAAYELTNTEGTIWQVTVPMAIGTQDYRFEVDGPGGWAAEWPGNDAAGDCFAFGNMRVHDVTGDEVLPLVCWESCSSCFPTSLQKEVDSSPIGLYVNAGNSIVINGLDQNLTTIYVYDIQGKALNSKTVSGENSTNAVIANNLSAGIYLIKVVNANTVFSKKVSIR